MTLQINQFSQTTVKGVLDLAYNPNTIPCRVKSDEATALIPGQAVKLSDVAGGSPVVTAVAADTDDIFGVVAYNQIKADFPANAAVEISAQSNVIYMESSAAIARGAKVMYVVTGQLVATATAGKSIVGIALDKATAANQLVRVYLLTFSGASDVTFTPAANVAAVATADASDLATAIALANALKTTLNAEIAALKAAGLQLTA